MCREAAYIRRTYRCNISYCAPKHVSKVIELVSPGDERVSGKHVLFAADRCKCVRVCARDTKLPLPPKNITQLGHVRCACGCVYLTFCMCLVFCVVWIWCRAECVTIPLSLLLWFSYHHTENRSSSRMNSHFVSFHSPFVWWFSRTSLVYWKIKQKNSETPCAEREPSKIRRIEVNRQINRWREKK